MCRIYIVVKHKSMSCLLINKNIITVLWTTYQGEQIIKSIKLPATPLPSITDTLRTLGNNLFVLSPIHPKKSIEK